MIVTQDLLNTMSLGQTNRKEPIAIIGIGCRFPGGVNNPESFWQLLRDEIDAIAEMPPGRFDMDAFYDPVPSTPGKIVTRQGGFLGQIDQFDPYFFGISPREADLLDPQQRLLLEVAWEGLEDAGQVIDKLAGSQTGVFVGLWRNDYEASAFADLAAVDYYASMGSGTYSASGRISFALSLRGPSITVNTHFSSSLVAVHLGCQSLWNGECMLVLAGGANVILEPHISIAYSQARVLAPEGRCRFGDARADGYVRSEGAGLVVLKPLSRAIADGDPIYAVIRGSAVNNDGRSGGSLGTPGRQGQEALLRQAYENAAVSPSRVRYIEAHGTGTQIGDQVELEALGAVMSTGRPADRPCAVGSVKTNFGHTEAAAGIAGLIKAALVLKHRTIPASLHLQEPNPNIRWQELGLMIPTEPILWPADTESAIAGVSSFGVAGTNAHVVLAEAPPTSSRANETREGASQACLLPLSARTPKALEAMAQAYRMLITSETAPPLHDICYTASCHRTHHAHRLAVAAESHEEMAQHLDTFLQGGMGPRTSFGQEESGRQHKIAFIFSGHGSQWPGMGQQLLEREVVFRQTLEHCEQAMQPFVDWSLLEQLAADQGSPVYRLNEISVIRPALVSIGISLAALWRSWGIEPDAVIGHSVGEVAAAYVAGALDLRDTMQVICRGSQLVQRISGQGAMAVVELSAEEAQAVLIGHEDRLAIAARNSPRSTVLSGDPAALDQVIEALQQRGVFCRRIKTDVASHSPQEDPLAADLLSALEGLEPRAASVPIYSTSQGIVTDGTKHDAVYWMRNMRQPVLFTETMQQLLADGYGVFIELSPHPILLPAVQQGFQHAGQDGTVLPSLRRNEAEQVTMLNSLGRLYMLGYPVDWGRLYPIRRRTVKLPSYPWQRERFWIESRTTRDDQLQRREQGDQSSPRQGSIRDVLLTVAPGRRRQSRFEAHLREQVAQVLRLAPSRIPLNSPLKTLGLDSLMTLELRNRLEASLGLTLSATVIFNYPTIAALAPYLADRLGIPLKASGRKAGDLPQDAASQAQSHAGDDEPTVNPSQLEGVSRDQVEALLAKELAAIEDLLGRDSAAP